MNNTFGRLMIVIVTAIFVIIGYSFFFSKKYPVTPKATPFTPAQVDPSQKYKDMLTQKCYADLGTPEEREIECKG